MTPCDNCPLRLYNTKNHKLEGIGNPFNGRCIVVPNVDYPAYKGESMSFSSQVSIIRDTLSSFTGEVLNNLYILPLIRCNETIGCEVDENIYSRCIEYFKEDVKKYNFKHILLLGDAARRFFNISIYNIIDCVLVSRNNRYYSVNYSPLVKNVNGDLGNAFENNLKQWYGDILNKHYTNKMIKL